MIVGIFDTGIDFRHGDFRDPLDPSKSRVLAIWDQPDPTGPPPAGYDYGTLWTREQVEATLRGDGPVTHIDDDGHGTHVAGIAAGNGAATGRFGGVAPEAEIIVVKADVARLENAGPEELFGLQIGVADGAAFIFGMAQDLGRPAVINASIGGQTTRHDGSTLEEILLDRLVSEAPGRAFVASAANLGESSTHWGGVELAGDSLWTLYTTLPFAIDPEEGVEDEDLVEQGIHYIGELLLFGSFSNADLDDTYLAVGLDSLALFDLLSEDGYDPGAPEAQMEWLSLRQLVEAEEPIEQPLFYGDGSPAGFVAMLAQQVDDTTFEFMVMIEDGISEIDFESFSFQGWDLWRIMAKGAGSVHVWSQEEVTPVFEGFLPLFGLDYAIEADNYLPTDNLYSIDAPASARQVIAAGAYANLSSDDSGAEEPFPAGILAPFSSRGPTTDGRLKPEIVAPGQSVTSSLSAFVPPKHWRTARCRTRRTSCTTAPVSRRRSWPEPSPCTCRSIPRRPSRRSGKPWRRPPDTMSTPPRTDPCRTTTGGTASWTSSGRSRAWRPPWPWRVRPTWSRSPRLCIRTTRTRSTRALRSASIWPPTRRSLCTCSMRWDRSCPPSSMSVSCRRADTASALTRPA